MNTLLHKMDLIGKSTTDPSLLFVEPVPLISTRIDTTLRRNTSMPDEQSSLSDMRTVYHELLMTQLKQHDEAINRLENKLDSRMDEIRDKIQQIMTAQQVAQATMGDRLTRLETRMDEMDKGKQDHKWLIGTILSLLAIGVTLFIKYVK